MRGILKEVLREKLRLRNHDSYQALWLRYQERCSAFHAREMVLRREVQTLNDALRKKNYSIKQLKALLKHYENALNELQD